MIWKWNNLIQRLYLRYKNFLINNNKNLIIYNNIIKRFAVRNKLVFLNLNNQIIMKHMFHIKHKFVLY